MEPIQGRWLEPVPEKGATPNLGFHLAGGRRAAHTGASECSSCGRPLSLLAVYHRSPFIPLQRYDALVIDMCASCARESDGSAGSNGFWPGFRDERQLQSRLSTWPQALHSPVHFRAIPTGEPEGDRAFKSWKKGRVKAKLGGRQIAIQGELPLRPCRRCQGPVLFVGSLDEKWARGRLNFGGGLGYLFACRRECAPESATFYWDCF